MTYSLESDARASNGWYKLEDTVRQQLEKKLATILVGGGLQLRCNGTEMAQICASCSVESAGEEKALQLSR